MYIYMHTLLYGYIYNVGWTATNSFSCKMQSTADYPSAGKEVQC